MKPSEREYTGPTQYFHNYEHDPEGRTHCRGPEGNPYRIVHFKGKHIINTEYAKGHGKGNDPQWFKFTKRFGLGWDLSSAENVEHGDIPAKGKTKIYFKINDGPILKSKEDHDAIRDKLKDLPPLKLDAKAQDIARMFGNSDKQVREMLK